MALDKHRSRRLIFWVMTGVMALGATLLVQMGTPLLSGHAAQQGSSDPAKLRVVKSYGKLPLSFEVNQGQTDPEVKFLSRGNGYSLFLTSTEAVLSLQSRDRKGAGNGAESPVAHASGSDLLSVTSGIRVDGKSTALRMKLVGSNPQAKVVGLEELPGKSNYFIGDDPTKWRTNVSNYAKVRYESVYSGIDLVYYGNQRQLEYDFVVAPGADPRAIRLAFPSRDSNGATPLRIDGDGDLVLEAEGSELLLHRPVVYQEINGARQNVVGSFVIQEENHIGFEVARYDVSKPLIIDPVLSYSAYLGGNNWDQGTGIAVDSSGNAYVTGFTYSSDFPTSNSPQGSGVGLRAFVTKVNATGSALVYSTFLSGSSSGIAVDSSGNAYITGYIQNIGQQDGFVAKLSPAGSALIYSIRIGVGLGIAVDSAGNAYVTGSNFVTKLNTAGSAVVYSTSLGGGVGHGIAIDSAGNAYVIGSTSGNLPTANPLQATYGGNQDAFVTKLNATGSALVYSTYLGGSGFDVGSGIAVDSSGTAYVTGSTMSSDFPTMNAFQAGVGAGNCTFAGRPPCSDGFVAKLNAAGSALVYSTYLGGNGSDAGSRIAVDSSGNAYVTGYTTSTNFPTANAFQAVHGGGGCGTPSNPELCADVIVTMLNAAGTALIYSTYLGGSSIDKGYDIAVDSAGNAYVTGESYSINFPTANGFQSAQRGNIDAFVTKISAVAAGVVPPPQLTQGSVVNNASFASGTNAVAPGTLVAIFGTNLTDGTSCLPPSCNPSFASNGRLNTTMTGAQVTVNGTPVPIFYSSPSQLGVQIPTELTGTSATVQVTVSGQSSTSRTIAIASFSPGIFTFTSDGRGVGAFTHVNGSPVTQQNPAREGELVILYATGLGQVTPSVPTGARPDGASATVAPAALTIDGITVIPEFAGLAGCCVGLNQINVRLPANTRSANNIPVVLTIGGVASNPVTIAVTRISSSITVVTVPGTADTWLAGQPGNVSLGGDRASNNTPVLSSNGLTLTPGSFLTVSATGSTNGGLCGSISPDGGCGTYNFGPANSLGGIIAPLNALLGVFLDNNIPDGFTSPPSTLDFTSDAARSAGTISPLLRQVFFIGDGLTGTGTGSAQHFTIPAGATRLFLGSADTPGTNYDNSGSFNVTVSAAAP